MDETSIERSAATQNVNEELDICLSYADLLLEYSRNPEIEISDGKLKDYDDYYSLYYFTIGSETYRKLKDIQGECFFRHDKNEYPKCEIISLEKDHLELSICDFPTENKIIEKGYIVINLRFIIKKQKKALELLKNPEYEERRKAIFGSATIHGGCSIECNFKPENELNEEQKEAIKHAVGINDAYLIWGPPGTGKTTVVPEITQNYIRLQKEKGNAKPKILVCSYTNAAVDTIAKKLFDDFKSIIVRFGKSTTLKGKYREICLENIVNKEKEKWLKNEEEFNRNKRELEIEENMYADQLAKLNIERECLNNKKTEISTNIESLKEERTDREQQVIQDCFKEKMEEVINQLDKINCDIKKLNEKTDEIEKNIISLEKQKHKIEKQLTINYLEDKKKEVEDNIIQNSEKLKKLGERKLSIITQIEKTKSEILQIEEMKIRLIEGINSLEKKKIENSDSIKIVGVYLDMSKNNIISAFAIKTKFRFTDPLYNRYKREIELLRVESMNFRELESFYSELKEDDNTIKISIRGEREELNKTNEKQKNKKGGLDILEEKEIKELEKEIFGISSQIEKEEANRETITEKINSESFKLNDEELEKMVDMQLQNINNDLIQKKTDKEVNAKTLDDIYQKQTLILSKKIELDKKINSKPIILIDNEFEEINLIKDKKLQEINGKLDKQNKDYNITVKNLADTEVQKNELLDCKTNINQKIDSLIESFKLLKLEIENKKNELISKILHERTIIATTNMMVCNKEFNDIKFDIVIMDEAGAIDLLGAVIPLSRTKKIVLLGDYKQLPPVIDDSNENVKKIREEHPNLGKSIFEIFKDRCSDEENKNTMVMLTKQYRMREEISKFVSDTFYRGKLECVKPKGVKYTLKENDDPILDICYPMLCLPNSFHTKYTESGSGYCEGERVLIKKIIQSFKDTYGKDIEDKIAIITPSNEQANRMRKEMRDIELDIECGTVHTFQGQEKEVIIYSTVKYRPNADGSFGRLLDASKSKSAKNLLNVAVSRAKEKFIIIGCRQLFSDVELYDELFKYIEKLNGIKQPEELKGEYIVSSVCKMCNEPIPNKYEYCSSCLRIHRTITFIEDKPRIFKAKDGDLLRSSYEIRIDDWFCDNNIYHEVEKQLPFAEDLYCDWFLPKKDKFTQDIYIEYWGLMENKEYEEHRKAKEKLYKKQKLTLLDIETEDMKNLGEILERKLRKYRLNIKNGP